MHGLHEWGPWNMAGHGCGLGRRFEKAVNDSGSRDGIHKNDQNFVARFAGIVATELRPPSAAPFLCVSAPV